MNRLKRAVDRVAVLGLLTTALVVPGVVAEAQPAVAAVAQDGPHAPLGRVPAATTVVHSGNVEVSRYDLGDVEVGRKTGQFRAPVRGSLVTPTSGATTKLVILSHLRSAGCADEVFAFPCPGKEMRLDRGMEYLGKALAAKGYTVLIPDLAPVWIGTTLKTPYDQTPAWLKVVGAARTALADDVAGASNHFRVPLKGRVDMSEAGLFVHSRSGLVAGAVAQAWAKGPTRIASILAYGPAYEVPDAQNHVTAPVPGNIPYLGLVGDADHDVPFNADLWLAENVEQRRTAAAAVATVPGLGHDDINQTLSAAHIDDRVDCETGTCPPASTHERFLTAQAEDFFDATLRHTSTSLPLGPTDAFPTHLTGLPASWLAVTNSSERVTVLTADTSATPRVSAGSSVKRCRFYDPQDPTHYGDKCPDPEAGTLMLVSKVFRVHLAAKGTLTVPAHVSSPQALELQIAPYGDRANRAPSSPLQIFVTTKDGRHVVVPVPNDVAQALRNRATEDSAGTYPLTTMRVPLPGSVRSEMITSVQLMAPKGGDYAIRAVEFVGKPTSATGVPPTTAPTKADAAATPPASSVKPSKSSIGPVVQTDEVPARRPE